MDWFLYERDPRHERVKYSHFMYLSFIQELSHDVFITFNVFFKLLISIMEKNDEFYCFHTQLEVFYKTKFHPGMKF